MLAQLRRLDGGSVPGWARTDDDHVVIELRHAVSTLARSGARATRIRLEWLPGSRGRRAAPALQQRCGDRVAAERSDHQTQQEQGVHPGHGHRARHGEYERLGIIARTRPVRRDRL